MSLEEKLRSLKKLQERTADSHELERQLDYLGRVGPIRKKLPAQRAPKDIREYVEGRIEKNTDGEYFVAQQSLPFGRPYGKLRIGDISCAELSPLNIFIPGAGLPPGSELAYLDTETTGLAGGTGTVAFMIGIGAVEGPRFVLRQYFLRDYPEEKAVLRALAHEVEKFEGVVTFNGKTFDIPLLETRYALHRLKSPFERRVHLDLLHPARRLWKLRLEGCELKRLEKEVLGIRREGDVEGSEIPGIYFDYLRTGDARGLQPVFYHNALDIVTLAALTVELAQVLAQGAESGAHGLDLFSLSRIFERAGDGTRSLAVCQRALAAGLPQGIETRALWQMALQHKRRRQYEHAAALWTEVVRRELPFAVQALEELAIYYEHRRSDPSTALTFTQAALERLHTTSSRKAHHERFSRRLERLRRKSQQKTARDHLMGIPISD